MSANKVDLERKVQGLIEQIRPYLQNDGGDIKFKLNFFGFFLQN
ncbi:MAG: hypothetical protein B7C24_06060 [Bacteroidetes bacterium 4572_77]|nr:MAG: hypothetical protein B7C24_06060 [Bacteroidetes bacterium 4572_77]